MNIINHRIDFFLGLNNSDILPDTLEADLAWLKGVCPLPQRIHDSLPDSAAGASQPVWRRNSRQLKSVSQDLSDAVRSCFDPHLSQSCVQYRMSSEALSLLNGIPFKRARKATAESSLPFKLEAAIKPAAIERLKGEGVDSFPSLRIDAINLYQFPTGVSIVVLSLSFREPPVIAQVQELVHGLSYYVELKWQEPEGNKNCGSFTVANLMRLITGQPKEKPERLYTSTVLVIDGAADPGVFAQPLRKLARHYQSDYRLGKAKGSDILLDEFDNRITVAALEGIAFGLFTHRGQPPYLANFPGDAYWKNYMPLILLALHQHLSLNQYSSAISGWRTCAGELTESGEEIIAIQNAIRNFRNNYQPPMVSTVSMHNQHYLAFRQALHVDALTQYLDERTGDLSSQLEGYLQDQKMLRQQAHEARICNWGALGVAAAALVTTHAIVNETLTSLHKSCHFLHQWQQHFGLASIVTALLVAIAAWLVQRKSCKHHASQHHHGPTHSLIHEHTNHKLLHGSDKKRH